MKYNEKDANKSATGSLRYNNDKPQVSQLDPRFILDLADLMTKSAKKYGKFNWALGQEFSTPFDSCMRHLMAFMSGEDRDKESGMSHLLHAAANIMIMYTSQKLNKKELDNRFEGFRTMEEDWVEDFRKEIESSANVVNEDWKQEIEEARNLYFETNKKRIESI